MRLDQIIAHVIGVGGGKANTLQPVHLVQRPDQLRQRPVRPIRARAVIGVHVLAQQGDFAHATLHQIARLGQDTLNRAGDLGPARIGHNAEGAELVAAFLHRQECRGGAFGLGAGFEMLEFVFFREISVERLFSNARLGLHLGQAVIALWADDQIDHGLAAHDLLTLGLRDAARDADFQIGFFSFQPFEPAKLGINLFGSLFPDVAGVEKDHIRVIGRLRFDIALTAQRFGHAFTVIDIHLTAIGLDIELLGHRASRRVLGKAA